MLVGAATMRTERYGALLEDTARDQRRQWALIPTSIALHQVLEPEGFLFLRHRWR